MGDTRGMREPYNMAEIMNSGREAASLEEIETPREERSKG